MSINRLFVVLSLLAATVPWFAFNGAEVEAGLPGWVLYSLLGTVVLIIFVECLILWFWDASKGDRDG